MLRSGMLAIGGLAGIVGMAGLAERVRSSSQVSADPGTTLTVYGTEWRLSAPGLRRGDVPQRGDLVSITGALRTGSSAEPVGDFLGSSLHLTGTAGHGPYSSAQQETQTFRLPGGTILGMGTNPAGGESVYAIVGGTGRYSGVTGSYIGRQSPLDTGGDGTAEFTFTFNSGR